MASYGHRNKQGLYKPTDFNTQQKRDQMKEKSPSEEGSAEQTGKEPNDNSVKKVTILKPPQSKSKEEETVELDSCKLEESSTLSKPDAESNKQDPEKEKPPQEKSLPKDQRKKTSKEPKKKVDKSEEKPLKKTAKVEEKPIEKPEGVSNKDLERIQKLREFMEKQQLNDQPKAAKEKGKDPKEPKKDQGKDRNQRTGRPKGKLWNDDSKNDGSQRKGNSGKRPASSGQNKKPQGETKPKEKTTMEKDKKSEGGTGAKPKGENSNSQKPNPTQLKNQQDSSKKNASVSGNFHRNFNNGPNNQKLPNNAQSILGNPIHPYQTHPMPNLPPHHVKQQQQQQQSQSQSQKGNVSFPVPTVAKNNKPHITVQATKDKNEHKRSLDFVKNFFNTDPEVQYHRQKNAEKAAQASAATTSTVSTTTTSAAAASASLSNSNQYMSMDSAAAAFMNANHHSSHRSQQNHHNNSMLAHNNMQLPLSMGSNFSNLSNFYQSSMSQHSQMGGQQNAANTTFSHGSSTLQQQQQQQQQQLQQHHQQQQRTSPGSYHTAIGHGAHQQRNFDMYSSMGQQNPLHHSQQLGIQQNSHQFPVRSHASSANNVLSNNYNMGNTYSNYFPSGGSPHSHVFHVQQEIDQSALSEILDDPKKPKKWQQKALNKCGPIDSQQARSLIKDLIGGSYECMVCCENIKFNNAVWSCSSCFHIFHLGCIRKWAKSEAASVKGMIPLGIFIFHFLLILILIVDKLCHNSNKINKLPEFINFRSKRMEVSRLSKHFNKTTKQVLLFLWYVTIILI